MSDYLSDLVTKNSGAAAADLIAPRRPSHFEFAQTTAAPESESLMPIDDFGENGTVNESTPARMPPPPRQIKSIEETIERTPERKDHDQQTAAPPTAAAEIYPPKAEQTRTRELSPAKFDEATREAESVDFSAANISPPTTSPANLPPLESAANRQVKSENSNETAPPQTTRPPVLETSGLKSPSPENDTAPPIERRDKILIEPRVERIENRIVEKTIRQTIISPPKKRAEKNDIEPARVEARPARIVIEPRVEKAENRREQTALQTAFVPPSRGETRSENRAAHFEQAATPVINVTIGRVEVRAAVTTAAPPKQSHAKTPTLGLDEYLRRRRGGGER